LHGAWELAAAACQPACHADQPSGQVGSLAKRRERREEKLGIIVTTFVIPRKSRKGLHNVFGKRFSK